MRTLLSFILICCMYSSLSAQVNQSFFFEGEIVNQSSKRVKNAKLAVLSLNKSFSTDKNGKFSINLPKGDYLVLISASDYKSKQIYIDLKKDTAVSVILESIFGGIALSEVKIIGRASDKVNAVTTGVEKLDQGVIDRLPTLLGEKDPIKALQLLPGIIGASEGSAEFNVRGGGNDQNMILLDNIPLYSSTHLFGLYSSINPLAISSTTIYKGDFPAQFGGRLSSVSTITSVDTLSKKFYGVAEMGIATAKASLAIPLLKQKSTIYLSGRRSYYDLLFKTFGKGNADIFKFQDYNLSWLYNPNPKNRIKLTLYHEGDAVGSVLTETGISKGSSEKQQSAAGLNWKHRFNSSLVNDLTFYYNDYTNKLMEEKRYSNLSYRYDFKSSVADLGFNNTIRYNRNGLTTYLGFDGVRHNFNPTQFSGEEFGEMFTSPKLASQRATELSVFTGTQVDFTWGGKLSLGLRNNNYYTTGFSNHSLEPRFSYLQPFNDKSSIKLSYSRMTQPVHRLNNPGLGLPQDIILSSAKDLLPQNADHFSIEFANDFKFDDEKFSLSIQPFYKRLRNIVSFRDGYDTRSLMFGTLFQANSYTELITSGTGKIFGAEFMLEKKTGKLNGWVNYTFLKASNSFTQLNKGLAFSPSQDRPHTFNMVANWQINKRWNIGATWMFISGQPINVPESVFIPINVDYLNGNLATDGGSKFLFEQATRGNSRMKPFHKLDITAEYKFRLAGMDAVWNIGAYNVYNRMNPSFYYLGKSEGRQGDQPQPVLKSVSLFPILPTSSLRIKF